MTLEELSRVSKPMAFQSGLFCFLYRNKKWLKVNDYKLYQFAVWVAESLPESKDAVVQEITRFTKSHLTELK